MTTTLTLAPNGAELADRLAQVVRRRPHGRLLLGLVGAPGAGKSRLATTLVESVGDRAAHVPMDGFHLADTVLREQGLLERKGAPETFDAWGYAALLQRLRTETEHTVYAPAFERDLEQPLAGAIAVPTETRLVVTEGNYLLDRGPGWREVGAALDEVWFVEVAETLRRERLHARHVAFGKTESAAREWVSRVDEQNARLVRGCRERADVHLDLTRWAGTVPPGVGARLTGGRR